MTKKSESPKKATPAKKSAPRKSSSSKPSGSRSWLKRLWSLGWKVGLALAAVLIFTGIYLDSMIKQRFEGQLFELPTVVYARILTLEPGSDISIKQMRNELDVLNYRKVSQPRYAGEYSASSTRIELIRRPFEFADGPEPDRHVMLMFDDSGLTRIQSLEKRGDLGYLRIEPKMLGMLEKDTQEQRLFLRREQFPEVMIDALLTTEDRNFYQHDGVSPMAIARAMVANLKAGRTVQGAVR